LQWEYSWEQALGAVFLSGILFIFISILPDFRRMGQLNAISFFIKARIAAGIGLSKAILRLQNSGITR